MRLFLQGDFMNVAVLVSGRGSNLKAILEAEKNNMLANAQIKLVVSNSSKAEGLQHAKNHNKKVVCLESNNFKSKEAYDEELVRIIQSHNIDLIVLAGFMRILSPSFVKHFENKIINVCIEKMIEADGIILGSPVYFSNVTTEMKALIDCAGYVARANNHLFTRKVGAAVVAVRRAGAIHVFNSINHFFLIGQMIIPGSSYWNLGIGREIGEVEDDEEGLMTMKVLGQNMAWLLNKLK